MTFIEYAVLLVKAIMRKSFFWPSATGGLYKIAKLVTQFDKSVTNYWPLLFADGDGNAAPSIPVKSFHRPAYKLGVAY